MDFDITAATVVPFLFIVTIGAVIVFALINRKKTIERKEDDTAPKSTLAKDAPDHR